MTRAQRTSRSQRHNRMKKAGYKWYRKSWWESWRFSTLLIRIGCSVPVYHSGHEEARWTMNGGTTSSRAKLIVIDLEHPDVAFVKYDAGQDVRTSVDWADVPHVIYWRE